MSNNWQRVYQRIQPGIRRFGALLLCLLLLCLNGIPGAFALQDPKIDATSAILMNANTGMVLYENAADEQRFPASTTKIMTALLTLENAEIDDVVTALKIDFEHVTADSSNADIKVDEQVTVKDLLYALMLPSANEAAYMLARHVGGSWENFVDMMNARATELGCTGTHFANPCGLHEENHYTTARDLLRITEEAMKSTLFREISNTAQYRMKPTNMHEERIIYTTNQLIFSMYQPWYYQFCKGVKTGHTSQAGNCLVAYAEKGSTNLYVVVMGCADAPDSSSVAKSFTEAKRLFEWGYDNFVSRTLAKKGDALAYIEDVRLSTETDTLVLTAKNDLTASIPIDIKDDYNEKMDITDTVPESINAPITAGQTIGTRTYSYNNVNYGTVELVALKDVKMSRVLYIKDKLDNFFYSTFFKTMLAIAGVFLTLYVLFNVTVGRVRQRQQRKRMRDRYENDNTRRRRR